MKKYLVTYTLIQTAEVEAETEEQAEAIGYMLPLTVDYGTVEVQEVK